MARRSLLALLAGLVCLPAVASAGDDPAPAPAPADAGSVEGLAKGERDFAFDLHRLLAAKGGNVFASAYSVSTALAMTAVGARGPTSDELRKALHLPEGYGPRYREFAKSVTSIPMVREYEDGKQGPVERPAYSLSIANAIFSQQGWKFLDPFRKSVADDFLAEFRELDFKNPPEARAAINDWVAKKTKDRIKDIVPEGMPTPDTKMALANAIHFKANWDEEFSEKGTTDAPFHTGAGKDVTSKRMRRVGHYGYVETPDAQIVEMRYKSGETSMVVVLPKAKDGLAAIEKTVNGGTFATWMGALGSKRVDVQFPKFTVTSTFELVKPLGDLGVKAAFLPSADFSGIVPPPQPLYIGAILHKAFVAVDEKGTEAAAATVVMMRTGSAMNPEAPVAFVVDHPFLFAIRHVPTGAILFLGRIDDPTAP